jgi:uncharacterized SAM-binding protein YcdF (DUF218 family)
MTRRRVALVAAVLLAALAALTARYVLWPETDEPGRADAVVVLAGGLGERLPAGRALVEDGTAPVLVVSHGSRGCGQRRDGYEIGCFTPRPDRTQVEARAAAALARERGWERLVVVTSTYHVARARTLFERCFDGEVRGVGVDPPTRGGLPTPRNLAREWVGWVHAFVVERGC